MPARRTRRLRLAPVGPEDAGDLWRLHQDEAVAAWHGGRWTAEDARRYAAAMAAQWAADGAGKWIAYDLGSGERRPGRAVPPGCGRGGDPPDRGVAVLGPLDAGPPERHNRRSRAVMERLGMGDVGELAARGLVEGRPGVHDDAPFALYAGVPGG